MKYIVLAGCLVIGALSTLGKDEPSPSKNTPAPAPGRENAISGKVVETMNAASYTYVQVDTGKKKVWAAAPRFNVKVGDSVSITEGMPMPNYHSKTLNRDFDVVYFAANVVVNGKQPDAGAASGELPKGHPPIGGATGELPKNHPPIGAGSAAKSSPISVKKAEGGKTVAEIYAGKDQVKSKPVTVRGKVVKYNEMIMGKNWLHIQDGTGAAGSNDLVVTTDAKAKVGDTVLVTGKVSLNKDFGSGYKYGVIMEDAKVKVE